MKPATMMGNKGMDDHKEFQVELFRYPGQDDPGGTLWEDISEIGGSLLDERSRMERQQNSDAANRGTPCERSQDCSAAETIQSFEAGREQGIAEGRETERAEQRALLLEYDRKRCEQLAKLSDEFARERTCFLQTAEQEVVKLALSIAARILRREAQTDPLFLIGAVRVALGQLADTVQVRLHIPSAEAQLWAETLSHIPNLKVMPTLVPDDCMRIGDCSIETEMGSVDLGLRAQLQETERVLLDDSRGVNLERKAESNPLEARAYA